MNDSIPPQSFESNLFDFHLESIPNNLQSIPHHNEAPASLFSQPLQHNYSFMSDTGPQVQTHHHPMQFNGGYSSPQLKPQHMTGFSRKRFKTVTSSNYMLDAQKSPSSAHTGEEDGDDIEDEDDDEDSGNDETDSNAGSVESGKKRGKYKIYTEEEKAKILNFMMKHGIQKTLEIFSSNTHKITKRKLKSWMESTTKIKGIKGRKTNDPNRDQALFEWCTVFQKDYGRAPTRKEATKKALELSADSSFQASKGWLDKFSKKYNYEFTPLKIIPPKKKNGDRFMEGSDSGSTASNHSSDFESLSPMFMQGMQPPQSGNKLQVKQQWSLDSGVMPQEMSMQSESGSDMNGIKVSSFFNFSTKSTSMDMGYEKKDMMPQSMDQHNNGFQPSLMGNNMGGNMMHQHHNMNQNNGHGHGHNFGLPISYQGYYPSMNYDMKTEGHGNGHYQMGFHMNSQINSDINSFLNTTGNHDNHYGGGNGQMKLEYPY